MIGVALYEFLLVFGLLLWGGAIAWYARQSQASIYHPITYYLIFHGILFAIRPVLAHLLGYKGLYAAMMFEPSWGDKLTVLAAADLALLTFLIVAARVGNLPMTRAPAAVRGAPPKFNAAFWVMLVICLPPALWSLAAGFSGALFGGGPERLVNMETGATVNTTANGYFTDANLMLGPIAVLIAWTGRFRWWSLLPLLLFVLARASLGSRWPFVMAVMSCAVLWAWERRMRWPSPRLIAAAVPLFLLFTIIGEDRGEGLRSYLPGQEARVGEDYFQAGPLESMDFGNMEFFEYMVHTVPAKTGTYDYFLINAQIATEPIPRVLWQGKPQAAPFERLFIWRYGTSVGATMSVPGEGWRAAGWVGVVLWTALFAFIYGRIYNAYVASRQDWVRTALFMLVMPVALQCFRDGLMLSVLKTSFFPLVPVIVWWGARRLLPTGTTGRLPRTVAG